MLKRTTLRNLFSFYGGFALPSILISLACIYMINYLGLSSFVFVNSFKYVTVGILYSYINMYKKADFYYYRNLGISKTFLWISSICFDLSLFYVALYFSRNA